MSMKINFKSLENDGPYNCYSICELNNRKTLSAFQFENPQDSLTAITSVNNYLPTPGKQQTICEDVWEAKKSYPKHDLSVVMIKVNYGDPQPPILLP